MEEVIGQLRDQIGTLQLKDATHRQDIAKLQRDNDYLKKQNRSQARTIEIVENQRDLDAESLLAQEERLNQLKGKYSKRDNPNEVA